MCSQQLKKENESKGGDFEAVTSVPLRENTRSSNSSYYSELHSETRKLVPSMSASKTQMALDDRLLPTANTIEPLKAKKEMKVPTQYGQNFTYSSVINDEKEPLSYIQALKLSSVEKWLDAMQEGVQNLNETWSSVRALYDKNFTPRK